MSRSLEIRLVRPALAAALLLLVTLFLSFTGQALAKDGQVTVRAAGTTNASVTIKLSELGGNDINNRTYRLRSGPVTISGHSLLQVMRAADAQSDQIDLATIPAIEIDRPGAGTITISGNDMRNPSAFADGPPVFYEDNGSTVFVMPGVAGSSGNRYRFTLAPVGISVSSEARYGVEFSASSTKVKPGKKVSFRATVTGQDNGETLSYRWRFGDGTTRTTSSGRISHSFESAGSYSVILDVTGSSGSGQSGILIEVGKTDKPKKGGNKKNPVKQPEGNQGTGGTGGAGGGTGDGFGTGLGSFGTGTGGGLPGGAPVSPLPSAPAPAPQPRDRKPKKETPTADGLVEVQGELVDPPTGATVVSPADGKVVESADPAPSGAEQGGFGIPGEAWTLAGVGLLLGLGAFSELRVFSRVT